MHWEDGGLHPVEFAVLRKRNNKSSYEPHWSKRMVPLPYARLVFQFQCEVAHGLRDRGHEAVRRSGYAQCMLEAFGEELKSFKGPPKDFRSGAFTPVLQRQARGMPDNSAAPLKAVMAAGPDEDVSISNATFFYLGFDPLDPRFIPSYTGDKG